MLKNSQAILLKSLIGEALTYQGLTASVKQQYQPRQDGVLTTALVLFAHIGSVDIGWPSKSEIWNETTELFDTAQTQRVESRWQLNALVPQTPNSTTNKTAGDYLSLIRMYLQSDTAIDTLKASGVGVQRINQVTGTYFQNDKGQNEESPSLDVVLSHQDITVFHTPRISVFNPILEGI